MVVEDLLRTGRKDLLLKLNKAIRVLGPSFSLHKALELFGEDNYTDEKCISEKLYEELNINGYKCQKLHNGRGVVHARNRLLIYKSWESLEKAMIRQKATGYFPEDGLLHKTIVMKHCKKCDATNEFPNEACWKCGSQVWSEF